MVLDIMDMGIDMDMVDIIDLMDMDTGEERRGMLMLQQLPLLMRTQMLILGTHTDMVLDIMDMGDIMDMLDTTTDLMDMDTHTGDRYQFIIKSLNCQDLFWQL